jgi:hypothetical protein
MTRGVAAAPFRDFGFGLRVRFRPVFFSTALAGACSFSFSDICRLPYPEKIGEESPSFQEMHTFYSPDAFLFYLFHGVHTGEETDNRRF